MAPGYSIESSKLHSETSSINLSQNPGKDSASIDWLGSLEYRILSRVAELGLTQFTPKELGLDVDRRRLHDALKRLVKRGILQRVARGLYRVVVDLARVLSLNVRDTRGGERSKRGKDRATRRDGTRVSLGGVVGGCGVRGFFLDNVRGYLWSGVYVAGDRGRVRGLGELVFFRCVGYAEFVGVVEGVSVDGSVVVYSNVGDGAGCARVEWRPPRGFVKRNGVACGWRMFWEQVLNAWKALTVLLLREAPRSVAVRALAFLRRELGNVARSRIGDHAVARELAKLLDTLEKHLVKPPPTAGVPP